MKLEDSIYILYQLYLRFFQYLEKREEKRMEGEKEKTSFTRTIILS